MSRFKDTADKIKMSEKLASLASLKNGTVVPVPLELIQTNQNVRTGLIDTSSSEFKQLVESIREVGLLNFPIITIFENEIFCVSGHRRIAAVKFLGHEKVHCTFMQFEKVESKLITQLLENTARLKLSPLDFADRVSHLQELGYSQGRLGELLGKDRKTIGRFQKMSAWPEAIKEIIRAEQLKFKTKYLLQLACRSISDFELLDLVKIKAGLSDKKASITSCSRANVLSKYFKENQLTSGQQELILKVLTDLKFIKPHANRSEIKRKGAMSVDSNKTGKARKSSKLFSISSINSDT